MPAANATHIFIDKPIQPWLLLASHNWPDDVKAVRSLWQKSGNPASIAFLFRKACTDASR